MFETLWAELSAGAQDIILLLALLVPGLMLGLVVTALFRPWPLVGAMLWRYRWTNLLFVVLMGLSVAVGVGLTAQERGLRQGTTRAAEKFDLIISAPGSEIQMMLAAVYLQPIDVELIDGATMAEISNDPLVDFAAPLAFGDSYRGHPLVGTTAEFVEHLSEGLAQGRMFATEAEAVAGGRVPLDVGDHFVPAHGVVHMDDNVLHEGFEFEVVGRMPMTGSPWDRAVLVPVESVWSVHGLPNGHPPDQQHVIGPPFDPDAFPGVPAVLVRANQLWANYALKSKYTRSDTMAFFPGTVLARLYGVLGDIRQIMSVMAVLTQVLVACGVLAGLVVLSKLFARRFALLRALGAPRRFVLAVVWCYASALIAAGCLLGLGLGLIATSVISRIVTARTDILVEVTLSVPELHLVAAFFSLTVFLALLPAFGAFRRPAAKDLRA